ncbi:MAG: class I SAM-dependent methyltransferase [Verrucomicrobiota bacterium]
MSSAALETLMLPFSDGTLVVPARALFLGATPHRALDAWPDITGWQPFKPIADAWHRAGYPSADVLPGGRWPVVLILPGKSRDETLLWFALARERLEPGGTIVAAMTNETGAQRFEKELAKATSGVVTQSKSKCRVFHATDNGCWNGKIFSEWHALGGMKRVENSAFVTQAGVFSHGRIDVGSRLLADRLPASLRGKVADLGAGWGFLTDAIFRRCPDVKHIDLYEADSRALACAGENLTEFTARCSFHWHDVAAGVPGVYDAIVMNPPFHTGKSTDLALGRSFITHAHGALRRGGKLLLVANRQLPYEPLLQELGFSFRITGQDPTFKVIFAGKR